MKQANYTLRTAILLLNNSITTFHPEIFERREALVSMNVFIPENCFFKITSQPPFSPDSAVGKHNLSGASEEAVLGSARFGSEVMKGWGKRRVRGLSRDPKSPSITG